MGSNSKLIREARNLAAALGHRLGEFLLTRIQTGSPPVAHQGVHGGRLRILRRVRSG